MTLRLMETHTTQCMCGIYIIFQNLWSAQYKMKIDLGIIEWHCVWAADCGYSKIWPTADCSAISNRMTGRARRIWILACVGIARQLGESASIYWQKVFKFAYIFN